MAPGVADMLHVIPFPSTVSSHPLRVEASLPFPLPLSLMPVSTRKKNAEAHLGRIILASQQPRRTRRQIEEDDAHSKAMKDRVDALHREDLDRLAQMEDTMEGEEEARHLHAARPDLCHNPEPPGERAQVDSE
jgi:hypothetical protein